jgi:hypothetical protein
MTANYQALGVVATPESAVGGEHHRRHRDGHVDGERKREARKGAWEIINGDDGAPHSKYRRFRRISVFRGSA